MERELPNRLFRLFDTTGIDFLENLELRFKSPSLLNDPFEVTPSFTDMYARLESSEQGLLKAWESNLNPSADPLKTDFHFLDEVTTNMWDSRKDDVVAVACFTSRIDWFPMWSYYASGHCGFAIEFDPRHSFFSTELLPVIYLKKRPSVYDLEIHELIRKKSWDSREESEWRLPISPMLTYPSENDSPKVLRRRVPPEAIKSIIFGVRTTDELKTSIRSALDRRDLGRVKVSKMVRDLRYYQIVEKPC